MLSARSELFAILSGGDTPETFDAAIDAPNSRPTIQLTARDQQKIAEQFCNDTVAARLHQFMNTTAASSPPARMFVNTIDSGRGRLRNYGRVKECNIRGCRNLANGRPLCAPHEASATGQYSGR
ncbi:hypothetical protein F441_09864 [Phytophthora nicotianae CJ01A1]|uniref:Uncharacterized protein n=3 Tax=Phytophthora nicotianae TaxID=4792 RepID=W2Z7S6_PHYNI|nr:hypothetical protein F441_09864 [Phytophthora nicotianae CJ01A1]ETP43422.1 hypothetical protein F442_09820 [Phytophthora nicotianae P10297]